MYELCKGIEMKKFFYGFCEQYELPIKQDDVVVIKKGIMVKTVGRLEKPAGKTYKVKVNHILSGQSLYIGRMMDNELLNVFDSSDLRIAMKMYGTDDLTILYPMTRVDDNGHILLHIESPKVVWAGPGGYWTEADINDLDEAQK